MANPTKRFKPLKALERYLERSELTQTELAAQLQIAQPTLSGLINGTHSASITLLARISKETGIPLEDLVPSKAA